ncbi:aminomethyltransferase family protein [bacterium]|nr:aminomethyltransferase family protein [bacterium]
MKLITNDWHKSKSAEFEDFFGVEVPSSYGNVEQEYWALRKNAGVRDVSFFGKAKITGRDAQDFLHRMISNDVKSLQPGKGVWALFLDIKGHIQGDMKVYRFQEFLMMILQRHALERVIKGLDRYVISEQLRMIDVSEEFGLFQIFGPNAASVLQSKGVQTLPTDELSFQSASINGIEIQIIRMGTGYSILVPAGSATDLLNFLDLQPIGQRAFNIFRIETGLPVLGLDFDDFNLPQESRLDKAISFTKGCYLGQEVIARLDAQGHVNKILVGLESSTELKPEQKLYFREKEIGRITSAAYSPLKKLNVALGYVRREHAKDGQTLQSDNGSTTVIVRNLPMV